ncbi:MAG: TVP38/TMEM64 family protein [Candidatus Pelagibacterales bacterium]|jgi:uncharacterized membrane protein YdjX (TVP38/TMEM64 family)|tara:strand:+ start:1595 stop:2290 length:696 start_codon:yes stop_codon:yes gene_type:complete
MLKKRTIYWIIFGIIALFIIAFIGKNNPISMELLITQHGFLREFILENYILSVLITTFLLSVTIALMGFASPVCILAGFYFGFYTGLAISIIGETIGAMVVFLYGRYLFKNFFLRILGERFRKIKDGFNSNAISYLLFIRIIGGVPFGIQNLLPAIFDMRMRDYFIATIFGVVPWAYILVSIGNGINDIVEAKEFSSAMLLNPSYLLPVVVVAAIVIMPAIYKIIKKRFLS